MTEIMRVKEREKEKKGIQIEEKFGKIKDKGSTENREIDRGERSREK